MHSHLTHVAGINQAMPHAQVSPVHQHHLPLGIIQLTSTDHLQGYARQRPGKQHVPLGVID